MPTAGNYFEVNSNPSGDQGLLRLDAFFSPSVAKVHASREHDRLPRKPLVPPWRQVPILVSLSAPDHLPRARYASTSAPRP